MKTGRISASRGIGLCGAAWKDRYMIAVGPPGLPALFCHKAGNEKTPKGMKIPLDAVQLGKL